MRRMVIVIARRASDEAIQGIAGQRQSLLDEFTIACRKTGVFDAPMARSDD
jgi:hypothetical protein